jgi:transposase-like protein
MNGTRCPSCGVDSSYVRKDGSHRCKKCGKEWGPLEGALEELAEDGAAT